MTGVSHMPIWLTGDVCPPTPFPWFIISRNDGVVINRYGNRGDRTARTACPRQHRYRYIDIVLLRWRAAGLQLVWTERVGSVFQSNFPSLYFLFSERVSPSCFCNERRTRIARAIALYVYANHRMRQCYDNAFGVRTIRRTRSRHRICHRRFDRATVLENNTI